MSVAASLRDIPGALSRRYRTERLRLFEALLNSVPKPWRVLEIDGNPQFWADRGYGDVDGVDITVLNIKHVPSPCANIHDHLGDATAMPEFADGSFDVVYSNSVIEHLGTWAAQRCMANEVRRVAKRHFIQTPNRNFPMEPHYMVPYFQFMPPSIKRTILLRFQPGQYGTKAVDLDGTNAAIDEIQLLSKRQMQELFPEARIMAERFLGLNKSWMAIGGWSSTEITGALRED